MCMIENPKPQFDTDSPDSGHREMSSDSLSLCAGQIEGQYWDLNHDERVKYSFGYSSPVKFRQMSYEMTAVVNSNPFVLAHPDKNGDQEVLDFSKFEEKMKITSPNTDNEENRLQLKLEVAPKLRPPPEFRNCDSHRNSIVSDDSSNSSNSDTDSIKDGIVNFTDSDYYTGSSSRTNIISQLPGRYGDSREVNPPALIYKPKLQYHYNNLMNEQIHMGKCYEDDRLPRSRASFSDEDNTESYDESLAHPPSPQPPPSRMEEIIQEE